MLAWSAWLPFLARLAFLLRVGRSGSAGSRAVDRSFRHGFRWAVSVGLGQGWSSSDQAVPGLAFSAMASSCFVFLLWSCFVRRLVQVQVWLRIYSSDWLAPWLVLVVRVSSCFAVGFALPGPMALAPRSMLGSAFGAVSSRSVRWWLSWSWLAILRCGHRSRVPVPAPSLPAGISRARSAIPPLVWLGVQGMQPGFWLFGLLFLLGCLPIGSYQTE